MKDALVYLNQLSSVNALNDLTQSAGILSHYNYLVTNAKASPYLQQEVGLLNSVKTLNNQIKVLIRVDAQNYYPGLIGVINSGYGSLINGVILDNAGYFAGPLSGIYLTSGGAGYTSAPTIQFNGGGGSGAAATAVISGVTSTVITNPGLGYNTLPTVTVNNSVSTTANINTTASTTLNVTSNTNIGVGYNVTINSVLQAGVTVSSIPPGSTTTVIVSGNVSATTAQTIVFNAVGTGAAFTPVLSNGTTGQIIGLVTTNTGSNYICAPTLTITGGTPIVAATATSAVSVGQVTQLTLGTAGTGYSSFPVVQFNGGGYSSTATAQVSGPVTRTTQLQAVAEIRQYNYPVGLGTYGSPVEILDNKTDLLFNASSQSIPLYAGDYVFTHKYIRNNVPEPKYVHVSEELIISSLLYNRQVKRIACMSTDTLANYNTQATAPNRLLLSNIAEFWGIEAVAWNIDTTYYGNGTTTAATVVPVATTMSNGNSMSWVQTSNTVVTRSDNHTLTFSSTDLSSAAVA